MADWDDYMVALRTLAGLAASEKRACDDIEERAADIVEAGRREAAVLLADYDGLTSQIARVQPAVARLLTHVNGSPGPVVGEGAASLDEVRDEIRRIEAWATGATVRAESLLRTRARVASQPDPTSVTTVAEPEAVTPSRPMAPVVIAIAGVVVCIVAIVIFMSLK